MDHKLFNEYLKMMDQGMVPKIVCGNDRNHSRPYVRFDDTGDRWHLACPACNWKMNPGMLVEKEIKEIMALYDVEWLNYKGANSE